MGRRRAELAARRRSRGLTQESLAAQLQVERTTVARWEAGDTAPMPWARPLLAQLLDITVDHLDALLTNNSTPPQTPETGGTESDLPTGPVIPAPRRASRADIAAMNVMAEAFARTDHQIGGGHASATVSHYLHQTVRPLLADHTDDDVGRALLVSAGRLHDLAGFMLFDAQHHESAQHHFAQALGLARAAENDVLTAHILGDMTMHAIQTGAVGQAVALSDGAVVHADRSDSGRVRARAAALAARARAGAGDATGSDAMVWAAERALAQAPHDDDPAWIRFFNPAQLQTEFLYAACALGRTREVERLAPAVLITDSRMQRRHVLASAAIAGAFAPPASQARGASHRAEPERALQILAGVLPTVAHLSSPRASASILAARGRLNGYGGLSGLDAFDRDLTRTIGAA
ncbi:helix-turn-helix transcriptional regulator [Myceligenerans indicum]|uniref:Helix-turn-helix transcriptional regulator n=1 Tax=Myceligenerans indicum TaxID=2593663 RepID=A0ABS1LJG7_9MICO|nr:helix-turn-helix transcriptional regulator [Myceligenerans indicum]MBL0886385.1 helix-turn-helix transcriptional regulator [Myceligenerans indicum]